MPETLTERLVALGAMLVALGLVVVALSGRREAESRQVAAPAEPVGVLAPSPAGSTLPTEPVASVPVGRSAATKASLVVTAARGSCWVSVHAGSPEGKALYEGILDSGRTIRLSGKRLWIRLDAAANVNVTVNGKKARRLPAGMVDLIATQGGVTTAPAT